MIVELFGPPAVGKTTLAKALTRCLGEQDCAVELLLSYRPNEVDSAGPAANGHALAQITAPVRRLTRAAIEMLADKRVPLPNGLDRRAAELIRLLPPHDLLWSMRLRQYLPRLCRKWEYASHASHVVLFDQAFVQALCSLILLTRKSTVKLGPVLELLPRPDLLIALAAPRAVLEARLRQRERLQGWLERRLEFDLATNLKSVEVIQQLHELLEARGWPIISVDSVDLTSLLESTSIIAAKCASRASGPGHSGVLPVDRRGLMPLWADWKVSSIP